MRYILAILLSTIALAGVNPATALAHNTSYFEYAPDPYNSERLLVNDYENVKQLFQPRSSISLTGMDIWADNTGSAGSITLTLRGSNDAFLAAKTITLPSLAATQGGQLFHVDFDQVIPLTAGVVYSVQISSSLSGFGIYHAKRASYLEHNQVFISPYVHGVAKLNEEEQTFSLKYALYRETNETTTSDSSPAQTEEDPNQEEEQAPEENAAVAITNARVSATTATTATIAWTTNIATDSRVTIRTQLSPLFIYASGYDGALELEHALTITGLTPDTYYFADVFSGQGNELLLSTYTIAFQTPEGAADPTPSATQPETGDNQSNTQSETNSEIASPTNESPTSTTEQETSTSTESAINEDEPSLPSISVGEGIRGGNFSISWSAPSGGEPTHGYRIDIFNSYNQLERQFFVSAGEYQKQISQLPTGEFRAVVYANNDGVFTKIAEPFSFVVHSRASQNIWAGLSMIILLFGLGSGIAIWWFMREKSPLPKIEE